jgi:hypothetical protein
LATFEQHFTCFLTKNYEHGTSIYNMNHMTNFEQETNIYNIIVQQNKQVLNKYDITSPTKTL